MVTYIGRLTYIQRILFGKSYTSITDIITIKNKIMKEQDLVDLKFKKQQETAESSGVR